jgi:hypothetical protein
VVATIPNTQADENTHVLYTYARSAQTGAEEVLAVTVQLNKPLRVGPFTPTPTPPPTVLSVVPCGSPTPTPTFPAFPVGAAAATPGLAGALTLRVSNPQPGDIVSHGMYVIQGLAFDTMARGSSGVDRVQVFLDPRDAGGLFLGDARLGVSPGGAFSFQLVTPLPNRQGGHVLSFYAHSSVADRETSVQVPVTLI